MGIFIDPTMQHTENKTSRRKKVPPPKLSIKPTSRCAKFQPNSPRTKIISSKLYVASRKKANDLNYFKQNQIKRIITLDQSPLKTDIKRLIGEENYMHIDISDSAETEIREHFEETADFIRSSKGRVLVHCQAGVSRSPTIAIAYLMREFRLKFEEAFRLVVERRRISSPNFSFLGQLKEYELQLERMDKKRLMYSKQFSLQI